MTWRACALLFLLLSAILLGGCASPAQRTGAAASGLESRVHSLATAIASLDESIDPAEARRAARVALEYPLTLAQDYELTTPPLWHNTLVNIGVKPRGLCVHWTRDMIARMYELRLRTLDMHWGVANFDATFLIEHSTAIISAKGATLNEGIVLDPWRNSGELFWARTPEDARYRWEPLDLVQEKRREREALSANRVSDTER